MYLEPTMTTQHPPAPPPAPPTAMPPVMPPPVLPATLESLLPPSNGKKPDVDPSKAAEDKRKMLTERLKQVFLHIYEISLCFSDSRRWLDVFPNLCKLKQTSRPSHWNWTTGPPSPPHGAPRASPKKTRPSSAPSSLIS